MKKQPPFNNEESKDLASILQNWVLSALSSVRSAHGKWVFHGGTALGQAYNSWRFSEDLDFMVDPSLETIPLMQKVLDLVKPQVLLSFGPDASVSLKTRAGDKNPACFHVVLTVPQSMSNIKVKVEFWETLALSTYAKVTKLTKGHAAAVRGVVARAAPAQIEVADLPQIFTDKWFALTQRAEVKHRDVWDLAWLLEKEELAKKDDAVVYNELLKLAPSYPNCLKGRDWLEYATQRLQVLQDAAYVPLFKAEMQRWLPDAVGTLPDAWFKDAVERVTIRLESLLTIMAQHVNTGVSNDFSN